MPQDALPPDEDIGAGSSKPRDSRSPWTDLARELAQNPDSPRSLRIQSAVSAALAPRQRAAQQVVDALIIQPTEATATAEAALQAAMRHWERVFGHTMTAADLDSLRQDAHRQAEAKANRPPPMESILGALPGGTDALYQLGVSVHGLEGTWHRLWGIVAMVHSFGQDPTTDESVATVRDQFEEALGRALTPAEWQALKIHAIQHADKTMK